MISEGYIPVKPLSNNSYICTFWIIAYGIQRGNDFPGYKTGMRVKNLAMYRCTLEVRGYELDSFNHVNNAVYLNYFEHARWQMIRETGLINYFEETGNFLVVVDIHIKYLREIRLFDKLVIETSVSRDDPYLTFHQEMYKAERSIKVSKAEVKTLLLDRERTPIDLPEDLLVKNG